MLRRSFRTQPACPSPFWKATRIFLFPAEAFFDVVFCRGGMAAAARDDPVAFLDVPVRIGEIAAIYRRPK